MRLFQAISVFFRILASPEYAARVAQLDAARGPSLAGETGESLTRPEPVAPPAAALVPATAATTPAAAAPPATAPPATAPAATAPATVPPSAAPSVPAPAPVTAPPHAPSPASAPGPAPLQLLALMQQEGRLVDFLQEEIQELDDAQIGAAVREIHKGCRRVISEKLKLEPIRTETEGASIVVPPGFDPSAIRLMGNVKGSPPFRGVLRHHGWRAREMRVSPLPAGVDPTVVAPAEVEVP